MTRLATYLSFVRFSHSVFALPFALTGALLAWRTEPFSWGQVGWIVVCMVSARSAAMGFNRAVDARFDALNPRTAMREIPRGVMSLREAAVFVLVSSAVFVFAATRLGWLCGVLSPVALGIVFWEVFFLVPTGRGADLAGLRPEECERIFALLHRVQEKGSFIVKVTEAPHYRRHVAQRERQAAGASARPSGPVAMPRILTTSEGPGHTVGLAPRGVNAGNGFLFVSHRGAIYPSGFLPLSVGNVRTLPLAEAYRESDLFRALRDPDRLQDRCGRCEFRRAMF